MKLMKLLVLALLSLSTVSAKTVVTVNGTNIDERELFAIVQKITRGQYAGLPNDKKKLANEIALKQAIGLVLVKQEAAKSNIKETKEYKKAFVDYVKNIVEPELTYQVWLDRELNKMTASDKEIKKFYNDNKDRFNQPKLFQVHHLLSKTEKEAQELLDLINKAKNKKAEFMKLASEKMGTADTGASDLGQLHENSNMAPAFKAAYLKMEANSFSKKPVKTQFGYHVIYVDSVSGGKSKTFAELKPIIKKTIQGEKLEKVLKQKVEALRAAAVIDFK